MPAGSPSVQETPQILSAVCDCAFLSRDTRSRRFVLDRVINVHVCSSIDCETASTESVAYNKIVVNYTGLMSVTWGKAIIISTVAVQIAQASAVRDGSPSAVVFL